MWIILSEDFCLKERKGLKARKEKSSKITIEKRKINASRNKKELLKLHSLSRRWPATWGSSTAAKRLSLWAQCR